VQANKGDIGSVLPTASLMNLFVVESCKHVKNAIVCIVAETFGKSKFWMNSGDTV